MTYTQRNAILNPAAGLIVYCTDCANGTGEMDYYNGTTWMNMSVGVASNVSITLPSITTSCGQTWTSQNLSVSKYRNGDIIPQVTDPAQWAGLTTGAWCWYNNDSATYGVIYGKLYNWYAVNDPSGLAPVGWHVPTDAEWNNLVKCIDPAADTTLIQSAIAGGALKEAGISHWINPNTGATNSSGFTGLPGGQRDISGLSGSFDGCGFAGYWWSSTSRATSLALGHGLSNASSNAYRSNYSKPYGFSVRLVRD
jgi:uncharacterized protein (TIGR02145 family)